MEDSAGVQVFPITQIESPFDQPIKDPKNADNHVIGVPMAAVRDGYQLVSLKEFFDEHRRRPATRQGTVKLRSTGSFVDFVNRYKHGKNTVVFVDDTMKKNRVVVTAIFDYHPEGGEIKDTGAGLFRAVIDYYGKSEIPEIQRRVALPLFWGEAP